MSIRKPSDIRPSEITTESVYLSRRKLVAGALAAGTLAAVAWPSGRAEADDGDGWGPPGSPVDKPVPLGGPIMDPATDPKLTQGANLPKLNYTFDRNLSVRGWVNSYEQITNYNNFYEFGTSKSDPAANAGSLKTRPWSVSVGGEVDKKGTFDFEDFIRPFPLQERIYRFRCVEAWSMVIPWVGFPLADLIKHLGPTSRAKYVAFTTLYNPSEMPGERSDVLPWPYVEALRMDEAMCPLTMMVVGLYGRVVPNQDGAPIRLIVPWKYGFKGGKSIVKISFLEKQPATTWPTADPAEYGFYANVNPHVPHPRWSQATERRIGAGFFAERVPTLMFNGYGEYVAKFYKGMNLHRYF